MQTQKMSLTGSCTFKDLESDDMENGVAVSTQSLGVESSGSAPSLTFGRRRKLVKGLLLLALVVFLIVLCLVLATLYALEVQKLKQRNSHKVNEQCKTVECLSVASTLLRGMNKSYDPCDDFAKYSCHGWVQRNPIPKGADEKGSSDLLTVSNRNKLRYLIEGLGYLKTDDPLLLVQTYYRSCINEDKIERNSLTDFKNVLPEFGPWPVMNISWNPNSWTWIDGLVKIQRLFMDTAPLMNIEAVVNPKNTTEYTFQILPQRLQMRESFIKNETKANDAYLEYMLKILHLLGSSKTVARQEISDVIRFEETLAKATPTYSQIYKNYYGTYYIWDLERQTGFPWLEYFNKLISVAGLKLTNQKRLMVPYIPYFKDLATIINGTSKRTLANYFMWVTVEGLVPYLSSPFRDAQKEFMMKLHNTTDSTPLWQRCVQGLNEKYGLNMIMGKLWIDNEFDKSIVPLMKEMLENIKEAFREEVTELEWLDEETKQKVRDKVDVMKDKMGYPEVCNNVTLLNEYVKGLEINTGDHYFLNNLNASKWFSSVSIAKLGKEVDLNEWFAGPQIVNAFYLMTRNEINILAGILQPPFYYGSKAPRAVNFGAIGTVLGHELIHGFDSWGRRFNKNGVIGAQWWSNFTVNGFKERSRCMIEQYGNFSIDLGNGKTINIDGSLTLSENIADNAGLKLAYRGYRNWVKKHGEEPTVPGLGLTNDQVLFVSFGQLYCYSAKPAGIRDRIATDSHALPQYRAIGSVSNFVKFSDLFHCPRDAKMNPSQRCKIW